MRALAAFLALATVLPASAAYDPDLASLENIRLAPVAFVREDNARLYAETAASLANIRYRLASLKTDGTLGYYEAADARSRLSDAAWRADAYFRALKDWESGSPFASAPRRETLLGQMRQAVDRVVVRLPR